MMSVRHINGMWKHATSANRAADESKVEETVELRAFASTPCARPVRRHASESLVRPGWLRAADNDRTASPTCTS